MQKKVPGQSCSEAGGSCDVGAWETKLQTLNMLPELIRMTCSMIGAWGSATADGQLLQLRTLDFDASSPLPPSHGSDRPAGGQVVARSPTAQCWQCTTRSDRRQVYPSPPSPSPALSVS